MSEEKPDWAGSLKTPPFNERRFTAQLKQNVLRRADQSNKPRFAKLAAAALGIPLAAALIIAVIAPFTEAVFPFAIGPKGELAGKPDAEHTYYDPSGRPLFTVYPEPDAQAGKAAGYLFHFDEPIASFLGKIMTLQAVHLPTGAKETLSSEKITQPSPGYTGLDRYTARFVLPLKGVWELNVLLDDKPYGHVRLNMREPSWDVTPQFQSGAYKMRGIEKKVGIIDAGFIAGSEQKYMWHFWGNDTLLNGPFEVKAVKQGTDNIIDIYASNRLSSANALAGELNGADRHAVTMMKLPEAGRWRLLPYVRGRLLDTIVVEVSK